MSNREPIEIALTAALQPVTARYTQPELLGFLRRQHGVALPVNSLKCVVAARVIAQLVPTKTKGAE